MVERARLESEYTGNRIGGSNPPLSAILFLNLLYSVLHRGLPLQITYFCTTFCTAKVLVRFGWICVVGGRSCEGGGGVYTIFLPV